MSEPCGTPELSSLFKHFFVHFHTHPHPLDNVHGPVVRIRYLYALHRRVIYKTVLLDKGPEECLYVHGGGREVHSVVRIHQGSVRFGRS